MRHFMVLFAALVTVTIIDVRAWPGDDPSESEQPEEISGTEIPEWSSDSSEDAADIQPCAEITKTFKPHAIRQALAPFHPNLRLDQIFARILTNMKINELSNDDAEGFAQWMAVRSAVYSVGPVFKAFVNIVDICVILEKEQDKSEEAVQQKAEQQLNGFLFPYTGKNKHDMSKKLATLLAGFICAKGKDKRITARLASNVAKGLLENEIQEELFRLISREATPPPAVYTFVKRIIMSVEKIH